VAWRHRAAGNRRREAIGLAAVHDQDLGAVDAGELAGRPQRSARIFRPVHREQDALEHSLILLTRLILPGGFVSSALPSGRAPFLEPYGQIQPIVKPPVFLGAADCGQELLQLTMQIQCVDGLERFPFLHVTPLTQR
jgi:hypothetical protein